MTLRPRTGGSTPDGLPDRLWLKGDNWLLWILLPAALLLLALRPMPPGALLHLVDWRTMAALAGLLALTKGVEVSGVLQYLSERIVMHVSSERRLALLLVSLSAGMAAVLTNDVSLFLIVPLTCSLAARVGLPLGRLVVFEALAVNAGSALTPIGNPQNLLLWQNSGLSFPAFVMMMSTPVAVMLGLVLAGSLLMFPACPLQLKDNAATHTISPWLLAISAGLLIIFVVLLDLHRVMQALPLVFAAYALIDPRILLRLDWTLLLTILLMFVVLGQVAALPAIDSLLRNLPIHSGISAYLAGVVTSQVISNVPATILLRHYISDLPALAAGVSVGGFGLLTGSLANLIALRLARQPGLFRQFHLISVPFLLLTTTTVLLLFL